VVNFFNTGVVLKEPHPFDLGEGLMELNPQVIQKKGKREFVILPYEEFVKIVEFLEDYEDLRDLRNQ
jgi:hypothetical protein